jgi:hypothetical protein
MALIEHKFLGGWCMLTLMLLLVSWDKLNVCALLALFYGLDYQHIHVQFHAERRTLTASKNCLLLTNAIAM